MRPTLHEIKRRISLRNAADAVWLGSMILTTTGRTSGDRARRSVSAAASDERALT